MAGKENIIAFVHADLVHDVPFDHAAGGAGHSSHCFRKSVYTFIKNGLDAEYEDLPSKREGGLFILSSDLSE